MSVIHPHIYIYPSEIDISVCMRRPVRKLVKRHFLKNEKNAFQVARPRNCTQPFKNAVTFESMELSQ